MTNNKLESYATRIDRLEEERAAIGADIKEIYTEVKSAGFNPKALRKVLAERRKPADEKYEEELDAYRAALGMPGATYRSVAEQTGVSKSKLQRLVPQRARGTEPPHDLKTREDTDAAPRGPSLPTAPQDAGVCTTHAQSAPDGGVGADTNSVEGGAPNSVRDGGAPVATSTVGPAVTTACVDGSPCPDVRCDFSGCRKSWDHLDDLAIPAHLKRERVA